MLERIVLTQIPHVQILLTHVPPKARTLYVERPTSARKRRTGGELDGTPFLGRRPISTRPPVHIVIFEQPQTQTRRGNVDAHVVGELAVQRGKENAAGRSSAGLSNHASRS